MMTNLEHAAYSVYENAVDTLAERGVTGREYTDGLAVAGAFNSAAVFAPDFGFTEAELEAEVVRIFGRPSTEQVAAWTALLNNQR